MSLSFYRLVLLWIFVARATPMTAQNPKYDEGALRIEGHQGSIRIVRGAEGVLVGKVQTFGGLDVAKVVSSSERAMLEAKRFARDYGPGSLFLGAGIVGLGAWMGVSKIHDVNHLITTGLLVSATGLILYGANRLQDAHNALARSIWWYNRDLRD